MSSKLFLFLFLFSCLLGYANDSLCDCNSCVYIRKNETCNTCAPPPPVTCAYNAPVLTGVYCPWKATLQGSFIYFQAKQENMQLALKTTATGTNSTYSDVVDTNWKYNTGYKVAGGFHVMHDNWNLMASYLYFHNSYNTDAQQFQQFGLIPFYYDSNTDIALVAESLNSKWKLEIDLLTAEIGRKYFVGRNFFIKSHFGVEGGWINQDLLVNYLAILNNQEETVSYDGSSECWCIGPRLGINTEWETSCFFRFIADGSIATLYTEYDLKLSDQYVNESASVPVITLDSVKYHNMCFLRPHLSLKFGLAWGNYVHCSRWFFDVEVAYQADVFFNQNPFGRPENNIREFANGDLYLHGLIVTGSVDF